MQLLDVTSISAYAWKLQKNTAGYLFVFVHVCVCVCVCVCAFMCVCVCVCVHVMQYQSHSPQPFVQGNDRERVPDPNWASGTLHTPPVIVSTALLIIQTTREDKQRGEWCFCVCVCVCVCLYMCNYYTYVRTVRVRAPPLTR